MNDFILGIDSEPMPIKFAELVSRYKGTRLIIKPGELSSYGQIKHEYTLVISTVEIVTIGNTEVGFKPRIYVGLKREESIELDSKEIVTFLSVHEPKTYMTRKDAVEEDNIYVEYNERDLKFQASRALASLENNSETKLDQQLKNDSQ